MLALVYLNQYEGCHLMDVCRFWQDVGNAIKLKYPLQQYTQLLSVTESISNDKISNILDRTRLLSGKRLLSCDGMTVSLAVSECLTIDAKRWADMIGESQDKWRRPCQHAIDGFEDICERMDNFISKYIRIHDLYSATRFGFLPLHTKIDRKEDQMKITNESYRRQHNLYGRNRLLSIFKDFSHTHSLWFQLTSSSLTRKCNVLLRRREARIKSKILFNDEIFSQHLAEADNIKVPYKSRPSKTAAYEAWFSDNSAYSVMPSLTRIKRSRDLNKSCNKSECGTLRARQHKCTKTHATHANDSISCKKQDSCSVESAWKTAKHYFKVYSSESDSSKEF